MKTVLRNARILTADGFRDDLALVIEAGRLTALVSDAATFASDALTWRIAELTPTMPAKAAVSAAGVLAPLSLRSVPTRASRSTGAGK